MYDLSKIHKLCILKRNIKNTLIKMKRQKKNKKTNNIGTVSNFYKSLKRGQIDTP